MSLLRRAIRSIQHHHLASSLLFIFYLISLASSLLFASFLLYLFVSKNQLLSTVASIKKYDNSLYAQPFENLVDKTSALLLNGKQFYLVFIVIIFFSTLFIQLLLFHFRKHEYQTYLVLNEATSKLSHQITIEQMLLFNLALLILTISYVFFNSYIVNFFSFVESSFIVNKPSQLSETTIQSFSKSTSILEEQGFTRFHIRPFLLGTKNNHLSNQLIRHQFPKIIVSLNGLIYCMIYLSNYFLFHLKTLKNNHF